MAFARTAGPAHRQVLGASDPLQGHQRLLSGMSDRGTFLAPAPEGLTGGKAGGLAANAPRRSVTTLDLLGQQHAQDLSRLPTLSASGGADLRGGPAQIGQPHPPEQCVDLGRKRRRLRISHRPNLAQASVPGWAEKPSSAQTGVSWLCWAWARMAMRSSSPNRATLAALLRAWSTSALPKSRASSVAWPILDRTRAVPLAAAPRNQRS